jgi:hypothetical protein
LLVLAYLRQDLDSGLQTWPILTVFTLAIDTRSYPSGHKPDIIGCLKYVYLRAKFIRKDIEAENGGRISRYGRGGKSNPIDRHNDIQAKAKRHQQRAKKRTFENDGRAPDTEALLAQPSQKKAKIGRRTGSTNKASKGDDLVDRTFGIQWSFDVKDSGVHVTNTCSMDSVLQLLYMLRKYGSDVPQAVFAKDEVLSKVLNQIDSKQFDEARLIWIAHVCDTFGSNVFRARKDGVWDLDSDSSVHSAASSLFQMRVRTEYDECQLHLKKCPHYCDYAGNPGIRSCGARTESFISVGNGNAYGFDLQRYFDCQHNHFGMLSIRGTKGPTLVATELCGTNIELDGRRRRVVMGREYNGG